jgi:predicted dehydrogenase
VTDQPRDFPPTRQACLPRETRQARETRETFRWGLIGAGDIVRRRVAEALTAADGCRLEAVSRGRADLVQTFAREVGATRAHRDWRDLVGDEGIDAVYIATPVVLHAAQTVAAAEAGKHVLCEKPMAMDVGECDRMIAACRANGVRLGVAYYRRFYPAVARIRQLIEDGELGTVVFAEMKAFEPFDPPPGAPRSWLLDRAQAGGGPMADFGCHRLEVLLHLLGPVRRAASLVATVALEREVEDTAAALLHFERGACGLVAVSHAAGERQDTFELFGTRGSIRMASLNGGEMVISIAGRERRESHPPAANVHLPLVVDFVDAVRVGRDPIVDGRVGRAVAQLQDDIYADTTSVR